MKERERGRGREGASDQASKQVREVRKGGREGWKEEHCVLPVK